MKGQEKIVKVQISNRILRTSDTSCFIAKQLKRASVGDLLGDAKIIIEDSQYASRYKKMESITGASDLALQQLKAVCHLWRNEPKQAKKIKYNPHKKTLAHIIDMTDDTERFILFLVDKYWSFLGSAVKKINKESRAIS
jgi:hypothetical protein